MSRSLSQVMLIVLTTTSTVLSFNAFIRSSELRMRNSIRSGSPKIARANSLATSTSKPSMVPLIGSRNDSKFDPMSSPTFSQPRL